MLLRPGRSAGFRFLPLGPDRLADDIMLNVQHITTDVDLNTLHNDRRWLRLIGVVKANKERIEADYDKPLVALGLVAPVFTAT